MRSQVNLNIAKHSCDITRSPSPGRNSPKSAEISQRQKGRNTQDFRSVYFNLFLVILPKLGSLFYTTAIPYKPLYGTHVWCLNFYLITQRTGPQKVISLSLSGRTSAKRRVWPWWFRSSLPHKVRWEIGGKCIILLIFERFYSVRSPIIART